MPKTNEIDLLVVAAGDEVRRLDAGLGPETAPSHVFPKSFAAVGNATAVTVQIGVGE